jgi:hypothetical protein
VDTASQLAPRAVADDSGFLLTVSHVEFIGLNGRHIADWRSRRAPFGMSPWQYREFCNTLFAAVRADRIADVDARLKGSAAVLYSGRHKHLPPTLREYEETLDRHLGTTPTAKEMDDLRDRIEKFHRFQGQPLRRPFDSMHKLGLDAYPSDYDVQLSSGAIEARCKTLLGTFPGLASNLTHPTYGFLNDKLVAAVIPNILVWASRCTINLGRTVAVKAFGASGPANQVSTIGDLSSHFRSDDWILEAPKPGVD